jgi:hypothetical protein
MIAVFFVHCHSDVALSAATSAGCQPSLYIRKMFSDCGSSWNFATTYSFRLASWALRVSRFPDERS